MGADQLSKEEYLLVEKINDKNSSIKIAKKPHPFEFRANETVDNNP